MELNLSNANEVLARLPDADEESLQQADAFLRYSFRNELGRYITSYLKRSLSAIVKQAREREVEHNKAVRDLEEEIGQLRLELRNHQAIAGAGVPSTPHNDKV